MNITYPAWATTDELKWKWCRRAQELLRKLHNIMGEWYRDGITATKYNNLPAKVKNRYSHTSGVKLSQAQWDDFTSDWSWSFEKVSQAIVSKEHILRVAVKNDNTLDVDLIRDVGE